MDKKVAIMTWYTHHNYGTALQVSAIYNKTKEYGYSPDVINYSPKAGRSTKTVAVLKKEVLSKAKGFVNRNYNSKGRKDLFLDFLGKHITETKRCNSYVELSDLGDEYDAFLCGSDQIWSPLNFDEKYFLPFAADDKKIAYAPSLGADKIDDPVIRERTAELINRFEHLSVRELKGAEIIRCLTGKNAKVVLDPTLLMTKEEWDGFVGAEDSSNRISNDYIICYFLGDYKKYMGYVRSLSKQMNIPYYVIPVKVKEKKSSHAVPFEVGPAEFVSLIKNARHVCTDSFHGIAFATNYQRPFSVFKRFTDNDSNNQNSRIFSFLSLLSLEDRLVDPKKRDLDSMISCDFSSSEKLLEDLRKDSEDYLKNSLAQATQRTKKTSDGKYKITDMCCGCGACTTVCSKGAITVSLNSEGFQHYDIDTDKCVKCGRCKTVCPMTRVAATDMKESVGLYSAKSNSSQVLKASSSGGVAHELSKIFGDSGAYVCGCAYDSDEKAAKHIIIEPDRQDKLSLLQGSKYIQSITQDIMGDIIDISEKNKLIFFGTPCQCAAVDKLCKKHNTRDNVYIVDLICHGVPSYYLWSKYLKDLNSQYGIGTNPEVSFRCNDGKWNLRTIAVRGNGVVHKEKERKDAFYAFFRRGLCDMHSCSECPYRERSSADLRIGDYWGQRFKDDKEGVSMIIANNHRGAELVSMLQNDNACIISEFPLEEYWKIQAPYNLNPSLMRERIIKELKDDNRTIDEMRKEYCKYYDIREKISDIFQDLVRIVKH